MYSANALELPWPSSSGTATGQPAAATGPSVPGARPRADQRPGHTAILNNAWSPLVSVVLDVPVTVGTLVLGNADGSTTSGFSISATGANALTMDNSGSTSHIIVQGGTHVISAPIILAGNLSVAPRPLRRSRLSGDISESMTGSALSLDDAGTLILSGSNGYTGGTFVNAGTLVVENPNGIPNGSSLTVGRGRHRSSRAPCRAPWTHGRGRLRAGAWCLAAGSRRGQRQFRAALLRCPSLARCAAPGGPRECGGLPPLFETVERSQG